MYRSLTTDEKIALAVQLAWFADWHAMREFVFEAYGPLAVRAQLNSFAEYNDEDYFPEITMSVFDAAQNELQPDLSPEQAAIAQEKSHHYNGSGYSDDVYAAFRAKELFLARLALIAHIPEGVKPDWKMHQNFDFTQEPVIPALFIEAEV